MTNADDDGMICDFCGYESDETDWFHDRPADSFGEPDDRNRRPHTLCGFCWSSYSVQRWLFGHRMDESLAKDQAMFANMLRAEIRGRAE